MPLQVDLHKSRTALTPAVPGLAWAQRWQLMTETLAHRGWLGSMDTCRRMVSVLLHWRKHRALMTVLTRPAMGPLLAVHPRLPYRYTMPYLALGHTLDQRRQMLQGHYDLMAARFHIPFMRQLIQEGLPVWSKTTSEGGLRIRIEGPCAQTRHREGELSLVMSIGPVDLYWLSFSLVPRVALEGASSVSGAAGDHVAFVGRVQGAPREIERMRRISRELHDVAPQDLLMSALAGVCQPLAVWDIAGVSEAGSISRDLFDETPMTFDYDAFWRRHHGQPSASGCHYRMTLPYAERPIEDIAAKHRGRTLAKRRFKRDVQDDVGRALIRHLRLGGR